MGFILGLIGCRTEAFTPLKHCEMAIVAELKRMAGTEARIYALANSPLYLWPAYQVHFFNKAICLGKFVNNK